VYDFYGTEKGERGDKEKERQVFNLAIIQLRERERERRKKTGLAILLTCCTARGCQP
jgi:hypothetical protein